MNEKCLIIKREYCYIYIEKIEIFVDVIALMYSFIMFVKK